MKKQNEFINAEIPVSNKHEAELAAKKAEELGYGLYSDYKYSNNYNYLTLMDTGRYGFYTDRDSTVKEIPLSDFLNQNRTETITLDNGEKWRVELIEKVEDEPMSAEEFYEFHPGTANVCDWMQAYAQYRLEFNKNQQHKTN